MRKVKLDTVIRRLAHYVWDAAGTPRFAEGRDWYYNAREKCKRFAARTGMSLVTSCGMHALASINASWAAVDKVVENLWCGKGMHHVLDKVSRLRRGAYYCEIVPVNSKTCNFAWNLLGHDGFVTVDRHMFNAARLPHNLTSARLIQSAVQSLADTYRMRTYQVQAIIWCEYRHQLKEKRHA